MGEKADQNAVDTAKPLPVDRFRGDGRESDDRNAALARGKAQPVADEHLDRTAFIRLGAHRLFTTLADNVRDYAVFLMDAKGIIRYWGEGARLMKWWTREQAEGGHLRMLYLDGGSEDGTAESHLQTAADTGEFTGEGQRVRSDASTFWAGVTLTALRDDDGTLLGFVKTTRDFSARRAVEAALKAGQDAVEAQRIAEEANRLKTLFIASVSHEIRTPLNAMMGFLEMLNREGERQQAHIARVLNSGTQLMQVVEDVLDMSRLEAGRFVVTSCAARLGDCIKPALSDVQPRASAKGVRLSNAVSGSAAEMPYWGDAVRVRQIILNLLSNAVKFTASGGEVTISAGTVEQTTNPELLGPGPWVYVRVEDTGEGIPAERLKTLFEPFEQAPLADVEVTTALGLSISRRMARLMAGDLTVRSEVGVGSEFVLFLPIAACGDVPR
jgi:PAS domain S-box-containing protein